MRAGSSAKNGRLMTIARKIRARIASSLSRIEETETFLWLKLLHIGELDHRKIEAFTYELWSTDNIALEIESVRKSTNFTFNFNRIKSYRLSQRKLIFKSKTNPVFLAP